MEPNCGHNDARGLDAGPGRAGDATTNWKDEDTRKKTIYVTLAASERPRPLPQQTANGQRLFIWGPSVRLWNNSKIWN